MIENTMRKMRYLLLHVMALCLVVTGCQETPKTSDSAAKSVGKNASKLQVIVDVVALSMGTLDTTLTADTLSPAMLTLTPDADTCVSSFGFLVKDCNSAIVLDSFYMAFPTQNCGGDTIKIDPRGIACTIGANNELSLTTSDNTKIKIADIQLPATEVTFDYMIAAPNNKCRVIEVYRSR